MPVRAAGFLVAVALSAACASAFAQPPGPDRLEYLALCEGGGGIVPCSESRIRTPGLIPLDKIIALEGVSQATANWYAVHDSSARVRASGVEKRIQDEALLQKIAVEDRDKTVRIAAVKKTQDQRFLERVSISGDSQEVRREAVARLTNQELVQKIALDRSQHPEVRHAAVVALESDAVFAAVIGEKKPYYIKSEYVWQWLDVRVHAMKDQEALKHLAWSAEPLAVQIFAAEALVDQPVLADLVQRHPQERVREAAVKRLTDQGLLLSIALNHPDEVIEEYAAGSLKDQSALVQLFSTAPTEGVRSSAAGNVTDPDLLRKLSRDPSEGVRAKAVKNLKDEGELVRLVDTDSVEVALVALGNVSNQEVLLRWAKSHPQATVRFAAIQALEAGVDVDKEELVLAAFEGLNNMTIARGLVSILSAPSRAAAAHHPNPAVRQVAMEEMERRGEIIPAETLLELTSDQFPYVRRVALRILDDTETFRKAGTHDPDPFVRDFALGFMPIDDPVVVAAILTDESPYVRGDQAQRIISPATALDLASRSTDPGVRRVLVRRIDDEGPLEKLENTDPDASVRKAAKERLQVLRRRK